MGEGGRGISVLCFPRQYSFPPWLDLSFIAWILKASEQSCLGDCSRSLVSLFTICGERDKGKRNGKKGK